MKLSIDDKKGLYEFIAKNMKPKDVEKKLMGEVFTPLSLVTEMVDKIEEYCGNTFFANPDLKILDPAAGIGNFPIVLFERLMLRLKTKIPNDEKRKKHILENILYINELNKKNYRVCKKIFESDKYKLNIEQKDFLQKDAVFGDLKFDLIIGNPPFSAHKSVDRQGSTNVIWHLFVKESVKMIKPNGFLSFIHPPSWRKIESSESKVKGLFELLTKHNTLIYLEMHSEKDGQIIFDAGTKYDWYIMKEGIHNKKLIVLDFKNEKQIIDIRNENWLPNHSYANVKNLVANNNESKCHVLYDSSSYSTMKSHVKETQNKLYNIPILHSVLKTGPRFYFTDSKSLNPKIFEIPKVCFSKSIINKVYIDISDKVGLTEYGIGIKCKNDNDALALAKYLESSKFKNILEACMWSKFGIDWRLFASFREKFWEPRSLNGGHNLFLRKVPVGLPIKRAFF